MKLFRTWTRPELVEAIRGIEESLTTGAQSVSYSGGGTVAYVARSEATRVLQQLYDRLDEIDGIQPAPKVRHIRVIARRGY